LSYIDIDVEENGIDSVDDRELFKTYDDAYRIQSDDQDLNENDYDGDADDLVTIIGVKLRGRGKTYHFSPAGLTIKNGNCVIVETAQGMELGVVSDSMQEVPRSTLKLPLKDVLRLASDEDLTHFEENKLRETEAIDIARERIVHYELDFSVRRLRSVLCASPLDCFIS
jgi:hypothetical protein